MPGAISSIWEPRLTRRLAAESVSVSGMAGSHVTSRRVSVRALVVLFALIAGGVGITLALTSGGSRELVPGAGNRSGTYDPLAYTPAREPRLVREAAAGESHIVYA